jgi:hypothetical protein
MRLHLVPAGATSLGGCDRIPLPAGGMSPGEWTRLGGCDFIRFADGRDSTGGCDLAPGLPGGATSLGGRDVTRWTRRHRALAELRPGADARRHCLRRLPTRSPNAATNCARPDRVIAMGAPSTSGSGLRTSGPHQRRLPTALSPANPASASCIAIPTPRNPVARDPRIQDLARHVPDLRKLILELHTRHAVESTSNSRINTESRRAGGEG